MERTKQSSRMIEMIQQQLKRTPQMENNEANRIRIASMTMESLTFQELEGALRYELCERYKREPHLFDSTVTELEADFNDEGDA
jgi:hypothetical protein